jgi:K+-transporting ATPase KdpF subunit
MPAVSIGCEARPMLIPILAFLVALGLAVYLVATLIAPERF